MFLCFDLTLTRYEVTIILPTICSMLYLQGALIKWMKFMQTDPFMLYFPFGCKFSVMKTVNINSLLHLVDSENHLHGDLNFLAVIWWKKCEPNCCPDNTEMGKGRRSAWPRPLDWIGVEFRLQRDGGGMLCLYSRSSPTKVLKAKSSRGPSTWKPWQV